MPAVNLNATDSTLATTETLIKSVANPLRLSLQYGLQTAGGRGKKAGRNVCECVRLIACVHSAIDVQRERGADAKRRGQKIDGQELEI